MHERIHHNSLFRIGTFLGGVPLSNEFSLSWSSPKLFQSLLFYLVSSYLCLFSRADEDVVACGRPSSRVESHRCPPPSAALLLLNDLADKLTRLPRLTILTCD